MVLPTDVHQIEVGLACRVVGLSKVDGSRELADLPMCPKCPILATKCGVDGGL